MIDSNNSAQGAWRQVARGGRFNSRLRWAALAWLVCGFALACLPDAVRAVNVPINFTGTDQQASGSMTIFGNVSLTGAGAAFNPLSGKVEPFVFTPPVNHPFDAIDPVKINTNPYSVDFPWHRNLLSPITPPFTQVSIDGGQLTDIQDFDFDVYLKPFMPLPAPPLDFYIEPFSFTTNSKVSLLKNVSVDFSGEFRQLGFEQTGAAILTPTGPGKGTFSVPGEGVVLMYNGSLTLAGAFQLPVALQPPQTAVELTGNYWILNPGKYTDLLLYGSIDLTFPLFASPQLATAISIDTPAALTISATLDLPVSVRLKLQYFFSTEFELVPEPGSITLFGLGLLAVVPVAVGRWHRRRASANPDG
jgi:hypothetical protein